MGCKKADINGDQFNESIRFTFDLLYLDASIVLGAF